VHGGRWHREQRQLLLGLAERRLPRLALGPDREAREVEVEPAPDLRRVDAEIAGQVVHDLPVPSAGVVGEERVDRAAASAVIGNPARS
jgi:hypothetical protein